MQSILRLTVFVFFGGCGVAAAVWFAVSSEPPGNVVAIADQVIAARQPSGPTTLPASPVDHNAHAPAPPSDVDLPSQLAVSAPPSPVDHNVHAASPQSDVDLPSQLAVSAPLVAQQVPADESEQESALSLDTLSKALDIISSMSNQNELAALEKASEQKEAVNHLPVPPAPLPVEPGLQEMEDDRPIGINGPEASLDADGRFQLNTKPDADLRQVLELLSQKSGLNIVASRSVQGTVSASLNNVDTMTALDAILKSTGYVAYQEGEIIFVGTADEYRQRKNRMENIDTRIYRPDYVTAAELQQLIAPLLTADVGAISMSSASEIGIQSSASEAGGDAFTGNEVVLVRDYESVLKHIDQIFKEVDRRPTQVAIEAMILSVSLSDESNLGVDFELLKNEANVRLLSGSAPASLGAIVADGGLKIGFLDGSTTTFVEALETIGDTNVIATPRLLVLNKQRAEILIGSELGYVSTTVTETAVTQAVEFLEVGTQLRIRPFISSDGMIRMEVHPELSTGSVRVEAGFTLPDKEVTEVTTNIMARDGSTVVIGGLMREDINNTVTQIPFLGSLPVIGPLFRQTNEVTEKREIIVLITPRIVRDSELNHMGNKGATEFHHRQAIIAEGMSWSSRLSMSRRQLYMSRQAWAAGNRNKAMNHVNRALQFYPQSREAIDLRADIFNGVPLGDHTGQGPFLNPMHFVDPVNGDPVDGYPVERHPGEGHDVAPWILNDLETRPPEVRSEPVAR